MRIISFAPPVMFPVELKLNQPPAIWGPVEHAVVQSNEYDGDLSRNIEPRLAKSCLKRRISRRNIIHDDNRTVPQFLEFRGEFDVLKIGVPRHDSIRDFASATDPGRSLKDQFADRFRAAKRTPLFRFSAIRSCPVCSPEQGTHFHKLLF